MVVELESDINESENPWDCRFARRFRNPTTFGFRFKLLSQAYNECSRLHYSPLVSTVVSTASVAWMWNVVYDTV